MHLTSPDGPAAGRISAHFMRAATKAATTSGDDDQSGDASQSGDGISFGGSFKTDPKAPFDLTADKLDVDDTAKSAVFTGNVVTTQGESTIRAQELTAFYSGSASLASSTDPTATAASAATLTHLRARKKVSIVSKDGQTATGDWAEVDVKKNLATLGGAVVLTQGKNIVKGTKVDIDMNTGQATIKTEPASGGGRRDDFEQRRRRQRADHQSRPAERHFLPRPDDRHEAEGSQKAGSRRLAGPYVTLTSSPSWRHFEARAPYPLVSPRKATECSRFFRFARNPRRRPTAARTALPK